MKLLLAASLVALVGCTSPGKQVMWIGNPALRTGDQFSPSVGWIPNYEFGFREDGVMVWRKSGKELEDKQ